jgi:SAM-dependent methyltransferase
MGELYEQFLSRTDLDIDKWHHYFPVYEAYLERFRGKAPRMLEIGVQNGGSARLFADWLGQGTRVTGLDIDPTCVAHAVPGTIDIEIGDQADREFMAGLVSRRGPWDIVIDDGGHTNLQIITTFEVVFPHLPDGAVYIIEDTHAHWMHAVYRDHPQGLSVVHLVADLFTKLHGWTGSMERHNHWRTAPESRTSATPASYLTRHVGAVHLYDSMIVVEKTSRDEPFAETRRKGRPRESNYRLRE